MPINGLNSDGTITVRYYTCTCEYISKYCDEFHVATATVPRYILDKYPAGMSREIYPTDHLREKMRSREITWAEIVEVADHPEVIYGPDERGRRILQRGKLSIVLDRGNNVITALLRQEEQWTDEEARERHD